MPAPFCVRCRRFMIPLENGVCVEEKFHHDQPYQIWRGDEMMCPACGLTIVTGYSKEAVEHFRLDFETERSKAQRGTFYSEIPNKSTQ